MSLLTGDDLARPAGDLPAKVIRDLGNMLHHAQYNTGNWEAVAEDLGYCYQDIRKFTTMANVKESMPGELMLRDWIQKSSGRTLFVLHSALCNADRADCVEFLETEIYRHVLCMDLMVCVKHEDGQPTEHLRIKTRADSSLLQSLQNVLVQPVMSNYKLLDPGVTWFDTLARKFKGRQLMILKRNISESLEQDPTIDSSVSTDIQTNNQRRHPQTTCISGVSASLPLYASSTSVLGMRSGTRMCCDQTASGHGSVCQISHLRRSMNIEHQRQVDNMSVDFALRPRSQSLQVDIEKGLTKPAISSYSSHIGSGSCNDLNAMLPHHHNQIRQTVTNIPLNNENEKVNNLPLLTSDESSEGLREVEERESSIEEFSEDFEDDSIEENKKVSPQDLKSTLNFDTPLRSDDSESECLKKPSGVLSQLRNLGSTKETASGNGSVTFVYVDPSASSAHTELDLQDDDSNSTQQSNNMLVKHSEYMSCDETLSDPEYQDTGLSEPSGGFDIARACGSFTETDNSYVVNTPDKLSDNFGNITEKTKSNCPHTADYQLAQNFQSSSTDSITELKQHFWSESQKTQASTSDKESVEESVVRCKAAKESFGHCDSFIRQVYIVDSSLSVLNVEQSASDSVPNNGNHDCGDLLRLQEKYKGSSDHKNNLDSTQISDKDVDQHRHYIDFNNYSQHDEKLNESVYSSDTKQQTVSSGEHFKEHQPLFRFISEAPNRSVGNSDLSRGFPYESLQRGFSCPIDVSYEKTLDINKKVEMPTIADVFSPVNEEFKLEDFEIEAQEQAAQTQASTKVTTAQVQNAKRVQECENLAFHSSGSSESLGSVTSKRQSFPLKKDETETKKYKFDRLIHTDSFEISRRRETEKGSESPELPPRCNLTPLNKKVCRSGTQTAKTVKGGITEKPPLDSLLADDKLFMHYKTALHGFAGWSPKETEHTIEQTMRSTLHEDGYYILWYVRQRRSLVLSVSFHGGLVNYRVHTKVLNKKLQYYITAGRLFPDILQLLQHYLESGVRAPAEDSHQMLGYRIPLKCPVKVLYDQTCAVSV